MSWVVWVNVVVWPLNVVIWLARRARKPRLFMVSRRWVDEHGDVYEEGTFR